MKHLTRFAIVGTGSRSAMFSRALLEDYRDDNELVALCDSNAARMDFWNRQFGERYEIDPLPTYAPEHFRTMLDEMAIDTVIVTTMDRVHHQYICEAMNAGCDVISEKPITVDVDCCNEILETQQRTGRDLRVTFNYRYAPRNTKVKELLASGAIGKVNSVHFEWLLDTNHGADYFRRWHRNKINSGGLMVHKSTHHFDLVNWWLDASPQTVYAKGGLKFYGRDNALKRGVTEFYDRAHGSNLAKNDPFAIDLTQNDVLKGLYLDAEHLDNYHRDQSVFASEIDIEDDISVIVGYERGATMTYHLTAYSPWEGYRVAFNGSEGRLELECVEKSYVSADKDDHNFVRNVQGSSSVAVKEPVTLTLQKMWEKPQQIALPQLNGGGHGGADRLLLDDLFKPTTLDPLNRGAGHIDGARSILTGIAANQSMRTGQVVKISDLIHETPLASEPSILAGITP